MSLAELQPDRKQVFVQKQRANIYTMMLILSLMEIVIGCLFLYLEMNAYHMQVKVPQKYKVPPAPAGATAGNWEAGNRGPAMPSAFSGHFA